MVTFLYHNTAVLYLNVDVTRFPHILATTKITIATKIPVIATDFAAQGGNASTQDMWILGPFLHDAQKSIFCASRPGQNHVKYGP